MSIAKKIDWLNHFLGFMVVIIGILIAFQLNTCSEEKKEATLVDAHIASIVDETLGNQKKIQYTIKQTEGLLIKLDTLLLLLNEEKDFDKINRLTLQMLGLEYNYIKKNSYNSLIQTGDIRFIKNFELKDDIVQLYEYYTWTEGVDQMTRENFIALYYPYIVDNMDMNRGTTQENILYTNKRFKNILATYKFTLKHRLQKLKDTQEIIKGFLMKYNSTEA